MEIYCLYHIQSTLGFDCKIAKKMISCDQYKQRLHAQSLHTGTFHEFPLLFYKRYIVQMYCWQIRK